MGMKTKTLLLIMLFLPLFVLADTYTGEQGVAQMHGDFITDLWSYFESDVPNFIQRMYSYYIEYITIGYIAVKIEMVKLSWSVAERILENYDIASRIISQAESLPQDVKAMLIDIRFFDGLNFIIQAGVSRFVMRFM
ncbi:DUF2523 family protein [Pseudoalteromonas sp. T1lg24]|uniref:DUF2523 family protein n=1 Tax=Pseudoalteromonas sp. T1lg24 TaxID=2077099 RepID=UPI000CF6CD23|nr:DUF2523 family protein [Pseudoalteromonas sp. T1lg24]